MAPSIDNALRVTSDLTKRKDEIEKSLEPVSYTHLDVYKRQILAFR